MIAIEVSYLPQLARLQRVKRADEISYFFPGLNLLGRLCALAYALHLGEAVFGLGFVAGIALRGVFLLEVAYYRRWPGGRKKGGRAAVEPSLPPAAPARCAAAGGAR